VTTLPTSLPFGETFDGLDFDGLPNWADVPTCGHNCPIFQVYHTDEVGGWEIFRLDGADERTRTTTRENLSLGLDPDVENLAPSLSPDNNWIVFQSNRDGNWELYVAPTSGENPDAVQRVTFNNVAIDGDPVWGPNNFVVFETTRHGNWDLYMIDMSTGQEYRLTDDLSDDINAFWSEDGSRLVFQSDRPDENGERKWQIYEFNLLTRSITRLSDGSGIDVDPQYDHNGDKIVFRSYAGDGADSMLMLMDNDGTNRTRISDAQGDATNASWSPSDRYIAYQSDLDGDLDIYVYEVGTGETRHLTDNDIADYAPTWLCDDERVMFTSDVTGDPNIFEVNVQPISDPGILVDEDADQKTFELSNDIYPLSAPAEENASREGQTVLGAFGEQTVFLNPAANVTRIDLSFDEVIREEWSDIDVCPAA
jgi:TolB protein